ncbi:MAG: beta-lactamase family protein [Xanthomonadales bacterium]|nr:beta-lactamase family protein [Xanthomonadales bacterium]
MKLHPFKMVMVLGTVLGLMLSTVVLGGEIEHAGISKVVRGYFPEGTKGGLALLVIKNDAVIHSKGYGLVFGKEPVTPQTPMGLASVTKQFTAMCAAFLIKEGKLNLTDKVSQHLADIRIEKDGRELLVQDLLWHTSGLPNFIQAKEKESIKEYRQKHGLKRLNNETHADWLMTMPLRRVPGTKFEYTNSGYVLLARIVEVIAGKPYHEFQIERIFNVLGMTNANASTRFNGSGNTTMSLDDYEKWDRALREGTLLDGETSKLLYEPGHLDNGEPVGYAFGWYVEPDAQEPKKVWHGGSGSLKSQARNWIIRDMQNRITVALFIRENRQFTREIRRQFAEEILDYVKTIK